MQTLRVALTGLGEFGQLHLSVLAAMPGVEIVGLVSRNREHAAKLAATYGIAQIYTSTTELIDSTTLDALFVATEDTRHAAPVLEALEAGIDVFVEKPISHDIAEARQMVATAQRLGRKFMVGHILRFDTRCAAVHQRIASGEMGRVVSVFGRRNMCRSFLDQYSHANRLFTTGVHDIDLILWYMQGRTPVEVFMKSHSVSGKGDDLFWGCITMDDGSVGVIETVWLLPDATPWRGHVALEVIGTEGTAHVEVPGNGLNFWFNDRIEIPDTNYWPTLHGNITGALRDEVDYFLRAIRRDQPILLPDPQDAVRGIEIAHALIRSAQEGSPIRL